MSEAKKLAEHLATAIHKRVQLYDSYGEQNNRLMLTQIQPVLEVALEEALPKMTQLPTDARFQAACAAMQGLLAFDGGDTLHQGTAAAASVEYADALLAALEPSHE